MSPDGFVRRALQAGPLSGVHALLFGIAAVVVPSLIRAFVSSTVSRAVFLTYVPFVILSGLMLKPRDATIVTLLCAVVADFFFLEPAFALGTGPNDLFSTGALLTTSALVVIIVRGIRRYVQHSLAPPADEIAVGPIFSEASGEAWAHWNGARPSVKLGPHKEVAEMMEDYIAQVELGERLTARNRQT